MATKYYKVFRVLRNGSRVSLYISNNMAYPVYLMESFVNVLGRAQQKKYHPRVGDEDSDIHGIWLIDSEHISFTQNGFNDGFPGYIRGNMQICDPFRFLEIWQVEPITDVFKTRYNGWSVVCKRIRYNRKMGKYNMEGKVIKCKNQKSVGTVVRKTP